MPGRLSPRNAFINSEPHQNDPFISSFPVDVNKSSDASALMWVLQLADVASSASIDLATVRSEFNGSALRSCSWKP